MPVPGLAPQAQSLPLAALIMLFMFIHSLQDYNQWFLGRTDRIYSIVSHLEYFYIFCLDDVALNIFMRTLNFKSEVTESKSLL